MQRAPDPDRSPRGTENPNSDSLDDQPLGQRDNHPRELSGLFQSANTVIEKKGRKAIAAWIAEFSEAGFFVATLVNNRFLDAFDGFHPSGGECYISAFTNRDAAINFTQGHPALKFFFPISGRELLMKAGKFNCGILIDQMGNMESLRLAPSTIRYLGQIDTALRPKLN